MVSLQNYYNKVTVSKISSNPLGIRIRQLLDEVILRLPDEEQFGIVGEIHIDTRDVIAQVLTDANLKYHLGPAITLAVKDGNMACEYKENLEESEFLITITMDNLGEKSDDYIKGLIAHKISELSYSWKITSDNMPKLLELTPEERMNVLNQTGMNSPFGSKERENYERNVDAEARRLGFSKELLAYDMG